MARLILLDSGPLGLIVRAPGKPQVVRRVTWLNAISANGATVIIPEIAHYDVRRDLLRIRAVGSPRRLDYALDASSGFRHLTLSTDAMIKAAEFWAFLRQKALARHSRLGKNSGLECLWCLGAGDNETQAGWHWPGRTDGSTFA